MAETKTQEVQTSKLCEEYLGIKTPLQICQSWRGAGWYIGVVTTQELIDANPDMDEPILGEPLSRDSVGYWNTKEEAQRALDHGHWHQRANP